MTFRRPKSEAHTAREWRAFTSSNRELFDTAGLPGVLSEDREAFDSFLMHGYLPMPGGDADGTRFSDRELDSVQRDWLDVLVALYWSALAIRV